jgi:hypothetical protein
MSALRVLAVLLVGGSLVLIALLNNDDRKSDSADPARVNDTLIPTSSKLSPDAPNASTLGSSRGTSDTDLRQTTILMPIPPPGANLGVSTAAPLVVGEFIDPREAPPINAIPRTVGAFMNPEKETGLDTTTATTARSVGEFRMPELHIETLRTSEGVPQIVGEFLMPEDPLGQP